MANVKEGDRVRIATREATEEDFKTGRYYTHFGGLTGSVLKVYNKDEVSIEIEHESLTKEIRRRHDDVRDQMKTKWLDGLSEEGRNKLTEREKDFNLRYVVLVSMTDLEKAGPRPVASTESPAARAAVSAAAPAEPEAPHRKTLAELEAAEEEELRKRSSREP